MTAPKVIFGFGDIGQRLASQLIEGGINAEHIYTVNRRDNSHSNMRHIKLDLDSTMSDLSFCQGATIFYLVPPPKEGELDQRARSLLAEFSRQSILPAKFVLLSTTGVYGDADGRWLDENAKTDPATSRGKRRLDSEQQFQQWSDDSVPLVVLRVPGIYANSRIGRARILAGEPVVKAEQIGFTNRIHADDLAQILIAASQLDNNFEIINVSDGTPGKMSDYLQACAKQIGVAPLPEIEFEEAEQSFSPAMLSYLRESRKLDNQKMKDLLNVELRYPDFIKGLKQG